MIYENKKYFDTFRSQLIKNVKFDGVLELPFVKTSAHIPQKVVTFSKAVSQKFTDFDCWVIFYEYDRDFERLWKNPGKYLPKLKKFKGVISPDFSIYRDMPVCMQIWNTYRGRALAAWMNDNGIEVIPNVRFGDARTFSFCFDGIEKGKTVAVGTHGCIKKKEDREFFKTGLEKLVNELCPENIIVYGRAPDNIFKSAIDAGINLVVFESEFSKSRKRGDA